MPKKPTTVEAYLASLPDDRREALEAIREVINANIGPEFEEGIQYGMIGWYLPHAEYPLGYHCDPDQPLPFASLASQKKHIGIYLFCVYCDADGKERFVEEWKATGKRLDMGAGCVRVKDLESVPLKVVAKTIKRAKAAKFVEAYESMLTASSRKQRVRLAAKLGVEVDEEGRTVRPRRASSRKKAAAGKTATKKAPTKKAATRKATGKGEVAPARKKAAKRKVAKKAASSKPATRKASKAAKATKKARRTR